MPSSGVRKLSKNIDFIFWGNCATTYLNTHLKLHFFPRFTSLCVDRHGHAASRAKQKHLNTNNNNNHPKQSFSLGFSTLREKFFFKLRSRFLISQEKLFCVCWNIHKPLGPNRIFKTEERAKATKNKDWQFFFLLFWPFLLVNPQKMGASTPWQSK